MSEQANPTVPCVPSNQHADASYRIPTIRYVIRYEEAATMTTNQLLIGRVVMWGRGGVRGILEFFACVVCATGPTALHPLF